MLIKYLRRCARVKYVGNVQKVAVLFDVKLSNQTLHTPSKIHTASVLQSNCSIVMCVCTKDMATSALEKSVPAGHSMGCPSAGPTEKPGRSEVRAIVSGGTSVEKAGAGNLRCTNNSSVVKTNLLRHLYRGC